MQTNRTLIFSLLFVLLGLSLMLGSPREVNAGTLSQTEWEAVAGSIDAYIQSQYVGTGGSDGYGDNGELGFIQTPAQYKSSVDNDTNNAGTGGPVPDGIICGLGDDMANRPVLFENLIGTPTLIPGTSLRSQWNSASTTTGALSPFVLTKLRDKVIAHREAGFSDAISVY